MIEKSTQSPSQPTNEDAPQGAGTICAVVVTFHPDPRMIENLNHVLSQVNWLVVVDNGSRDDELAPLRLLGQNPRLVLLENGENLGVGEALNRGIAVAQHRQCAWVVLFDQDSRITDGYVSAMIASWRSHPSRDRVLAIHPRYVDPETGRIDDEMLAPDDGLVISMTSGALLPIRAFDIVGLMNADYFIDYVDFEYCLRIRAAGYIVARTSTATLLHSAGAPQTASFLIWKFKVSNHSALRRYYISRNFVPLFKSYFRAFPRWMLIFALQYLRSSVKSFFWEQDGRKKFRNFLLGAYDGIAGRMGRRDLA